MVVFLGSHTPLRAVVSLIALTIYPILGDQLLTVVTYYVVAGFELEVGEAAYLYDQSTIRGDDVGEIFYTSRIMDQHFSVKFDIFVYSVNILGEFLLDILY